MEAPHGKFRKMSHRDCRSSSTVRVAMKWNPFNGLGRAPGGQWQTWRRTVERETKELARSEITSHKSHTMASWDSLCTMPHRGLRTKKKKIFDGRMVEFDNYGFINFSGILNFFIIQGHYKC